MAPRKLKSETKKMSKASRDRLNLIRRKGSELMTLCDIEGCIVVLNDNNRLITAQTWSKQKTVHQILSKYHKYIEEQRRKELKKAGVKSCRARSTGRHCDDKSSLNGCVPDVMQPHSGDVLSVNVDSLVFDDMEMQAEERVSLLSDNMMDATQDVISSDCLGYFPGNMGIDNTAGQSEDADISECLPDIGGLVDMERQLENGISSEFVGYLPELGFKDMGGQFEDDNFDYLLTNFDFDGIVGQSAFKISSDHVTLPDFASDYSHEECFPECLSDIGGPVDMERQLENGISSEFVGHFPEMGFKDMGEQFENDNFDYLLTNFDFDGIVGQSDFEISSDHVTLPDFASDYSHEECFPEEYSFC